MKIMERRARKKSNKQYMKMITLSKSRLMFLVDFGNNLDLSINLKKIKQSYKKYTRI